MLVDKKNFILKLELSAVWTPDKQHLFTKVWFHGYIIWWKKYELHEKIMKYQSRAPHRDIIALLYQGKTGLWQY